MTQSSRRPRLLRPALALGAVLLLSTGAVGMHSTAFADSSNTRTVAQEQLEQIGSAAGSGVAVSGPAVAYNVGPVQQINVQVIAGDAETRANSTQTASNDATLNQGSAAGTGDATAEAGSTAITGPAVAGNVGVVYQLNVQIIAGRGCDVDQVASNTATLDQQAAAASGDSTASNGGDASTGAARARNTAVIGQRNLQVYICRNGSTGEQVAENIGNFSQTSAAATGDADASGGSAGTGGAASSGNLRSTQTNRQIVID